MSRDADLKWFLDNRKELAQKYSDLWLVVHRGALEKVLKTEEEAIEFAVSTFGIDSASVFQATAKDPFIYVGASKI